MDINLVSVKNIVVDFGVDLVVLNLDFHEMDRHFLFVHFVFSERIKNFFDKYSRIKLNEVKKV